MPAATVNLTGDRMIEQGASWRLLLLWNGDSSPINLTGYTARMQIRKSATSSAALLELTTENSRITLGGVAGTITLTLTAADTAAITWTSGVYDLELVDSGGGVRRLIQGAVRVSREVTRTA